MKLPEGGPRDIEHQCALPAGPFRDVQRVSWGECDPAQIAYTAQIPGYGLKALEVWLEACIGAGFYGLNVDHGVGTPFVRLECSFSAPVTPRDPLVLSVTVERIGRSSLHTRVVGEQGGRECFEGRFACVFVDSVAHRSIPIPSRMRANLLTFANAQGTPFEDRAG